MLGTPEWWATPRPVDALPCGSRSMTSTSAPCSASAAARLTVDVVLPTPPFWFATVRMRRRAGRGRSCGPDGFITRTAPAAALHHDDASRRQLGRLADVDHLGTDGAELLQGRAGCGQLCLGPVALERQQATTRTQQRERPAGQPAQRCHSPRSDDVDLEL